MTDKECDIFEKLEQQTVFSAVSSKGTEEAMVLARNAMIEKYILEADTSAGDFGEDVAVFMEDKIREIYADKIGGFANGQFNEAEAEFQINPYNDRMRMFFNADYLCSSDEANEAKCVAAKIAQSLSKKIKPNSKVRDIIRVFQQWMNKNFEYKETGSIADHTATGLFRNGTGVCQAVAAAATLVLPQLGVPTQYVSGELVGREGENISHAWNVLRTERGWIHADFTCGKNMSITPGTGNGFADFFKKNYSWDEEIYSDTKLDAREDLNERATCAEVRIKENCNEFEAGNVKIKTVKPVIVSDSRGCRVDMRTLMNLLGGGFLYFPRKKEMLICTHDISWMMKASDGDVDTETGYVDISVLEDMAADIDFDGETYKFHF